MLLVSLNNHPLGLCSSQKEARRRIKQAKEWWRNHLKSWEDEPQWAEKIIDDGDEHYELYSVQAFSLHFPEQTVFISTDIKKCEKYVNEYTDETSLLLIIDQEFDTELQNLDFYPTI